MGIFASWITHSYLSLFSGKVWLATFALIGVSTAFVAIFVRGFQVDTWAWTEFYSDSYYYMAYAKQASIGNFFNYSGVGPSSGIHPLHWLFLTACLVLSGGNEDVLFFLIFAAYAVSFAATVWAVVFTLKTVGVRPEIRFMAVIAMSYGNYLVDVLGLPLAIPIIFTNFTNMMESWLLITAISLMVAFGVRHLLVNKTSQAKIDLTIVACAAIVAVWSRVDYVLVVLPFVAVVAWRSETIVRKQRLALTLLPLVAVAIWHLVLWNVTGIPISTSGSVKSLLPIVLQMDLQSGVKFFIDNSAKSLRELHILIALAGLFGSSVLLLLVTRTNPFRSNVALIALSALLIGMISLLAYHVLFTFQHDIGGWYFRPYRIPLLIVALFGIGSIVERRKTFFRKLLSDNILVTGAGCLTILIVLSHLSAPSAAENSISRAHVVRDVVNQLGTTVDDSARFLDGTDGAFGWFSNYKAYHIKGMANTPEYVDTGRLLRLIGTAAMSDTFETYMLENKINYVVSYGSGDVKRFDNLCWSNFQTIAYGEHRTGSTIIFAYSATRSKWLDYLNCLTREDEI